MTSRRLALAASALLIAGLLGGCATNVPGAAPGGSDGGSDGGATNELEFDAVWLDGGRMVGIVTQGSSSCVPIAEDVALAGNALSVTLAEPEGKPCTRDFVPRITLVGLPEPVDPKAGLEIRVTGDGVEGDTDLDGVDLPTPTPETDYRPSAGWVDDGLFAIVTWGSSSCAPVIEDVAATGDDEVTVTFQTPPADQVCTMDMAPRAALAFVDGVDDDGDVYAVLTGAEFDGVRIPIIGG